MNSAELDLDTYSQLRAPIDGRIGDRRVSVGNLVTGGTGGNTTLLATIVSVDPIRFEFTFDEQSYLRYERFRQDPDVQQQQIDPAAAAQADNGQPDKPTDRQSAQQADPPPDPPSGSLTPTASSAASIPAYRFRSS